MQSFGSTYGEVFIKQFGKQDCNKFRLIFFPEPAGPHPDGVIDRYFTLTQAGPNQFQPRLKTGR